MRIVSLLPATTEILFAVGAGDDVVGVTFECDHPPEARERRVVSTSGMPEGLSPSEIDAWVSAAVRAGRDLYHLDRDALATLDADLVVTQDLCAVCAVPQSTVDDALGYLGCRAQVLSCDPRTLDEVLDSIVDVGASTGRDTAAAALVADLRARRAAVARAVAGLPRPRVAVLEWVDPPFAPGHWVPEMVTEAGGESVLGTAGAESGRTTWETVADTRPDLVLAAPCGYSAAAAAEQARAVLDHLPPGVPVWAVDADGLVARPGPRLVDGIEAFAAVLHPEVFDVPDPAAAQRIR